MSINIWTDSMQHAALLGKPVLFTNWLIQRDIIPDGWYCYDLRGTHKSPSTRTTLVDHAADYHAGTVLSPIPLKHEGTASRRVNGTFYLLGEEMTLEQFCEEHDLAYPQDNREFVLRPASLDEVGLFYSEEKLDEALGTVGHLRMDFGHGEKEFWHTWWPHNEDRFNTPEFKEVLQRFVDDLRQTGLLKNLGAMDAYCWQHGGSITEDRRSYGYIAETENYRFCLRCTPFPGEYQGYLYCYDLCQQEMYRQEHPVVGAIMFLVIGGLAFLSHYYTLDGIKSKTVGDGQHGTARWATKQEIRQTYAHVPFEPELWRKGEHLPEKQGLVLGCEGPKDHVTALVDTDDIHAMVTAASGAGKTAFFLYPNIEYALASGMSFLCTDTKGDLFRNYAGIAKDCYGYQIAVLDLRNPTRSDGNNLLHLINKYMDIYKADPKNLAAKAKAEKYSKILAKTLINTSGGDSAQYGQNAFFYDSAEGLLTAMFLLVAEYLPTEDADGNPIEKRHIVSVFKLVQELLAPSRVKGKNQFQLLLEKLPPNHKARWFAGSALNTAEQAMASVISTVLSRLNAFLDSEMEQILCFDTAIDAEKFCNEKSAIFIVLPEEDQTKYFMVSLILQNLYREILTVADENGGRLKNRVVFFADELGTCPPIQSLELMFSASRSRGLMLVPIVQSITGQLQKNYGKEGSEIIVDNCQVNLYGGFAPASQTAVELSKSLGSRTVMSGSISRGKNDPSQSLQMMERPLMTPDELKSMPKGSFIVAKTGVHPMKVKLRLFLDWGIRFGMPYEVPEKAQRFVAYADKQELEESIIRRHYGTIVMDSEQPQGGGTSAGGMAQGIQAAPDSRKTVFRP